MAKISKEEIKSLNGKEYEIEQAGWNGNDWNIESGYFTDKGVVRFAGSPMEIIETYDEIDDDILEACIESIVDDDDDEDDTLNDMDMNKVVLFAKENNITSKELILGANELIKNAIEKKVAMSPDKAIVYDSSERPCTVAHCFDACLDVWINSVKIDKKSGELVFDCTSVTDDSDQYEFEFSNFAAGSLYEMSL